MSIESAVRQLIDRAEIRDVLMRYARGIDRRDLDLVASCFTADADYEGALGKGTIADALAALRERLKRYASTMHVMANQLIELEGDRARCETYAVAYHELAGAEQGSFSVGIRYLDELVRRDGRWLIGRRVVKREWEKRG